MKIGYDAKRIFHNFTGLGNYSRTLVSDLQKRFPSQDYILYTPDYTARPEVSDFLDANSYTIKTAEDRNKLLWRTKGLVKDLISDKIDLYHGLSHDLPIGIKKSTIPSVVTIHDLIFRRFPEGTPAVQRLIYDKKFKYSCNNADKIIAISESTKKDIIELYGINEDRIEVIYQSCNPRFQNKAVSKMLPPGIPEEFCLYVGSIIPRKNLMGIAEAMMIQKEEERLPIVVVGSGKKYYKQVRTFINNSKLEKWFHFIDYVENDELQAYYEKAIYFIYPSYYEGFGIPIIEALFSNTPVITSNTSSLPEAGGAGAIQIDPANAEAIAHAMNQLAEDTDLQNELIANGKEHIKQFASDVVTPKVMQLYKEVIQQ